jgi:energy-coupling factor transporter ATP-binding protein EcfA2
MSNMTSLVGEGTEGVRITDVKVTGLFGQYSYDIRGLQRCAILYGDNGVGKTNILTLLYHLLSPAPKAKHRTLLTKMRFQALEVNFSTGIQVSAFRETAENVRTLVTRGEELLGGWTWGPKTSPMHLLGSTAGFDKNDVNNSKQVRRAIEHALYLQMRRDSNPNESEEAYLAALKTHVPPIYLLAADRVLRSDELEGSESEVLSQRVSTVQMVERGRQRALSDAINYASHALYQAGVKATALGRRSMHSIYSDLLRRIAARTNYPQHDTNTLDSTLSGLGFLSMKYDRYAKYGLSEGLGGDELTGLLRRALEVNSDLAHDILTPYLDSLKEQAHSFDEAFQAIDSVIGTLNDFLFDKEAIFDMVNGIQFKNHIGERIDPSDLSSGEQQLVLLFCHIVTASNRSGIFIIDEPEISLNIKWQRKLVDALLELDSRSQLQFVMASHSMEILSKHRSRVISLENNRI